MYDMYCTRLDIAFAIGKLSRYTHNPNADYWKGILRILGFIKRTKSFRLFYNKFPLILEGYSDISWKTSIIDNKSMFGWIFTL